MKELLKIIADNPNLSDVLKEVLVKHFTPINDSQSLLKIDNQLLGQYEKARIMGLHSIESAFREIAEYKTVPDSPPKINRAR